MTARYDAIVVGARCAGAPTAMLLARRGYRVLMVDRAAFPSDTLSTHMVHPPGVAALARWGLLGRVTATGCPPVRSYVFDFGPVRLTGTPRPHDGVATGYAPRRMVLDALLVEAAVEAGVELRERFNVDELVFRDGAAVGIRGHGSGGSPVTEHARVVIGADGRASHVARAVRASSYRETPSLQYGYYSYWSDLPVAGFEAYSRPDRGWGAIPTNDGLTVVVVGWPHAQLRTYKADVEANYLATLELAPEFADRVRGATRVAPFVGGSVPNFFRTPFGPGWVLVGDAGYTKDPITAQGMTDAFRDAERCAAALDDAFTGRRPFADAMADHQRARDTQALALHELTLQLASLTTPPEETQRLLAAAQGNREAMDDFASVVAGTLSPARFFDPGNVTRILQGAAAVA